MGDMLSNRLELHAVWLQSLGFRGVRLDLSDQTALGVQLPGALMIGARLRAADLRQANLAGAIIDRHTKLDGARGLNRAGIIDIDEALQLSPLPPGSPHQTQQLHS